MGTFSRATFNGNSLGYYEYGSFSYEGNVQTRIIPRALGVQVWNTSDLGGGILNIELHVFVVGTNRQDLENQVNTIIGNCKGVTGSLVIGTATFTNCYCQSISHDTAQGKTTNLTIRFIKSA